MHDHPVEETNDGTAADGGFGHEQWPAVILGSQVREMVAARGLDEPEGRAGEDDETSPPLVLERACDVAPVETSWLWPWRIPHRRLTILAGRPRELASQVAFDIASRVSRGSCWPDQPVRPAAALSNTEISDPERADLSLSAGHHPGADDRDRSAARGNPQIVPAVGNVLVISADGDTADTAVPALRRARADTGRVYCLTGVFDRPTGRRSSWARDFRLPENYQSLRRAIRELAPLRLVVIDPIETLLHSSAIGWRPRIVEEVVAALVTLARECDVAIVGVAELRRVGGRGGMGLALRESALAAGVQAAWGITRCGGFSDTNLMVPIRMSVGTAAAPLEFACGEGGLEWAIAPVMVADADVAVATTEGLAVAAGMTWLRNLLADGALPAIEVMELARRAGLSRTLLRRVSKELGLRSEKRGWRGRRYWSVPNAAETLVDESEFEKVRAFGVDPAPLDDFCGILKGAGAETAPRL